MTMTKEQLVIALTWARQIDEILNYCETRFDGAGKRERETLSQIVKLATNE